MKKIIYTSIFFACCLLVVFSSCKKDKPSESYSEENQQDSTTKMINNYIEDAKQKAAEKPIEINVDSEILNIKQSPPNEHNLRYSILAKQLFNTNRINDAIEIVHKINETSISDTCFASMARRQIGEFNKSFVENKSSASSLNLRAVSLSEEIIVNLIKEIGDPLLWANLSLEFAVVRAKILGDSETANMLVKFADEMQNDNKASGIQRMQSLKMVANWLLNQNQKEQSLAICKTAELITSSVAEPIDAVFALNELSALYILLNSITDASRVCDESILYAAKITTPAEKATAILKIAEMFSILQINFKNRRDVGKFVKLKKLILAVDPIIAKHDSETENDIEQDNSNKYQPNLIDDKNSVADSKENRKIESTVLSWRQIRSTRDMLLRNLSRRQAWLVPESRISLDDVLSTIHEIEDDNIRDDAIITAIDMLNITGSQEEAKNWTELINNKNKKIETIKKIQTKAESIKNEE
jgi:hypothetical protein